MTDLVEESDRGKVWLLSSRYWLSWSEFVEIYLPWLAIFVRHIQFEVGAGLIVRFWQDIWCGDTSLCVRYPRLFFCKLK